MVAFLPSRDSFSTTFHKHCRRRESLEATPRHITVVGSKQLHAPCNIPTLQQSLFLSQLCFMEIIGLSQKDTFVSFYADDLLISSCAHNEYIIVASLQPEVDKEDSWSHRARITLSTFSLLSPGLCRSVMVTQHHH